MKKTKEIWKPLVYRNVIRGRYVISSFGRIRCLWRRNNQGRKFYYDEDTFIKAHACQCKTSSMVHLAIGVNKQKGFYLNTIMIHVFKIKKPDSFNLYRPYYVDGNIFNNHKDNIGFKLFTQHKINGQIFQPENIVRAGKLIAKRCLKCGVVKPIHNFKIASKRTNKETLKNKCVQCSGRERWNKIKANDQLLKKSIIQKNKFNNSQRGRQYHLQYGRDARKNISDFYVRQVINRTFPEMPKNIMTTDLIELERMRIFTKRQLQNTKIKQ